ncbi:MAG: hypothetical protein QOE59_240 [Actinomycetota bacterium]|jgi:hypothetical protein|nr:hypothetical protein [Actinomycetota bacterium]
MTTSPLDAAVEFGLFDWIAATFPPASHGEDERAPEVPSPGQPRARTARCPLITTAPGPTMINGRQWRSVGAREDHTDLLIMRGPPPGGTTSENRVPRTRFSATSDGRTLRVVTRSSPAVTTTPTEPPRGRGRRCASSRSASSGLESGRPYGRAMTTTGGVGFTSGR